MEEFSIINLFLVLLAAWFGGALATKLGYPAILGELIIGIILGPALLGFIDQSRTVMVIAEVGIILLMVYIGMEIDFRDLGKASWAGLLAAIGGFIVPFGLGFYTITAFGGTEMSALFVAIAVGVTSLATKSRILVDLKLLNTRIAYVLMAGALISDTLALVIFAGIVSFADVGVIDILGLLLVAGKAILFFIVTAFIGIKILPLLLGYFEKAGIKSSTLYFTLILIIAFGFAELAELAGMHSILGAFLAGLFIRDGVFPKNVAKEVHKTFYDVSIGFMAPIFFVTAGFQVSLAVFETDLLLLVVVIFVAMFGKIVGTALFYLPSGYGWREGITVGAGMNGRGAVEIIIAGIGLEMGIINQDIFSILVFMAIFTTTTVPFLLKWTTSWLRKRGELVQVDSRSGYLILGINPVSLILANQLKENSKVIFIDNNKELSLQANKEGFISVHGNALKEEILEEAQAAKVNTFISMTGNSEVNLLAAQIARETFLVPNNYVMISPNEDGAGVDVLDTIKASTIFAMKFSLDEWIHIITTKAYIDTKELVEEEIISTRAWVKLFMENNENIMPIVIIGIDGGKRPFQYDDVLVKGEKVYYFKAK
ncbi:cation:proton antiporter [Marivirga sp. S37H4]|uniref:Cation:proton antiporter n=1 Tax=Marivirga aurantiaca TaxID=2802615 RepID=A0A934WXQ9_9BACT|nr:cation:proton antiporter [Marivirga aurantiaca]MBK6264817.1 cation:proton antiporter [Marivirga aurantiaca]